MGFRDEGAEAILRVLFIGLKRTVLGKTLKESEMNTSESRRMKVFRDKILLVLDTER